MISSILNAQSRINYILEIAYPDKIEKKFSMNLDIENNTCFFYDEEILKGVRTVSKSNQMSFHALNSDSNEIIVFTPENKIFKIENTDKIEWKLENEFKQEKNYKLQKATANYGERTWTAWFCSDINIFEGPYVFRGLPGLIFELYDSENIFNYKLTEIEKLSNASKRLKFDQKIAPITWEKYNKNLADFYNNPFNKERMSISGGNEINIDNKDIQIQDLNKMTVEFQNRIKLTFPPAVLLDKFSFYKTKILDL